MTTCKGIDGKLDSLAGLAGRVKKLENEVNRLKSNNNNNNNNNSNKEIIKRLERIEAYINKLDNAGKLFNNFLKDFTKVLTSFFIQTGKGFASTLIRR
jgi:hypothetical protein